MILVTESAPLEFDKLTLTFERSYNKCESLGQQLTMESSPDINRSNWIPTRQINFDSYKWINGRRSGK